MVADAPGWPWRMEDLQQTSPWTVPHLLHGTSLMPWPCSPEHGQIPDSPYFTLIHTALTQGDFVLKEENKGCGKDTSGTIWRLS